MAAGVWNSGTPLLAGYNSSIGSPVEALIQQFVQGFGAPPQISLLTGLCAVVGVCAVVQSLLPRSVATAELPTVDLDYVLQKPTFLNTQYDVYVFSDIRYAAPPTGANRFRAPQTPLTDRSSVQSGGEGRACAQASPKWQTVSAQFVPRYVTGQTQFSPSDYQSGTVSPTPSSRETEDCLFLDVYAPRSVFENAGKGAGAPVIVQIYGGGFVSGVKDLNPAGFLERDRETGGDGIVVVSLNYRLGALGWLAGSALQSDGDANAGLLDQQFALQWVQKYIGRFGGNANNVTVIGESAGGASILHHITSYGGSRDPPSFQRAIVQSPAFFPVDDPTQTATTASRFLQYLGVSNLDEARAASFEAVYAASAQQIGDSQYGSFTYGPVVDGTFVPSLPGQLLSTGKYHKDNLQIIVGHNANEGIAFTSPFINSDATFAQFIGSNMSPSKATLSNLQYISNTLYPPIFDGSNGYTDQIGRASKATAEQIFTCNTFYLNTAFSNNTSSYSYLFAVPPAFHGSDVPFTYWPGPSSFMGDFRTQIAVAMQTYFLNFVHSGRPDRGAGAGAGAGVAGSEIWERFGVGEEMLVFSVQAGIVLRPDDTVNERCRWWQTNL